MKISEFIRDLKKQGIKFHSHGKKHDVYYNPANGKTTRIGRHQNQEIRNGTRDSILKDLGLK